MKKRKRKIYWLVVLVPLVVLSVFFILTKNKSEPQKPLPETKEITSIDPYTKNINELLKIVDEQDPRVALAELQHRMDTDPYVFQNCHAMAHEIGHEAYKKYKDFVVALSHEEVTCSDGYLHGIIEERFTNITDIYGEMKKVCAGYTKGLNRCYHGVGHGVMYYTGNNLPKALAICKTYRGIAQKRCNEGVFMENFISGSKEHPSKYLDPKNIVYPCPSQTAGYKNYCYFYVPYYFLHLHNYDFKAAIAWCSDPSSGIESSYVATCIRGAGSIAMKYNIKDPKYVESICNTSIPAARGSCISGMVSYYLTFTNKLSEVAKMCTLLDKQNKIYCNKAVKQKGGFIIN